MVIGQKVQTSAIYTNTINKYKATVSLRSDFSCYLIYK